MLETSRESHGYDGVHGNTYWWFEAWGTEGKSNWTLRDEAGRPPSPEELARADYIVFGFRRKRSRNVFYRTRTGGLDLRKPGQRKRRR